MTLKIEKPGAVSRVAAWDDPDILADNQSNITFRQLPHLVRQWRLWLQITRNFAMIEGSWLQGPQDVSVHFRGISPARYPHEKQAAAGNGSTLMKSNLALKGQDERHAAQIRASR